MNALRRENKSVLLEASSKISSTTKVVLSNDQPTVLVAIVLEKSLLNPYKEAMHIVTTVPSKNVLCGQLHCGFKPESRVMNAI